MTGFGAAEGEISRGTLRVEIRTVNHRYFNLAPKLASDLLPLEGELRERLRRDFDRGHVAVSARWIGAGDGEVRLAVDMAQARQVVAGLRELQTALGLSGSIDLALVARQPDVLVRSAQDPATVTWPEVEPIVARAAQECRAMREREGAALSADILARLDTLEQAAADIARRAPERLVRERDRLRAAVRQLMDGAAPDEARLAQELALSADRLDVTEELVRLGSHLDACRQALGSSEAIGKRLGFLSQELGREVNTIGSKANDAGIAALVIGMKGELEKIREQLENLE